MVAIIGMTEMVGMVGMVGMRGMIEMLGKSLPKPHANVSSLRGTSLADPTSTRIHVSRSDTTIKCAEAISAETYAIGIRNESVTVFRSIPMQAGESDQQEITKESVMALPGDRKISCARTRI